MYFKTSFYLTLDFVNRVRFGKVVHVTIPEYHKKVELFELKFIAV